MFFESARGAEVARARAVDSVGCGIVGLTLTAPGTWQTPAGRGREAASRIGSPMRRA
jgi:hypothetical protein